MVPFEEMVFHYILVVMFTSVSMLCLFQCSESVGGPTEVVPAMECATHDGGDGYSDIVECSFHNARCYRVYGDKTMSCVAR